MLSQQKSFLIKIEWVAFIFALGFLFIPAANVGVDTLRFIGFGLFLAILVERSSIIRLSSVRLTKFISILTPMVVLSPVFLSGVLDGTVMSNPIFIYDFLVVSLIFLSSWSIGFVLKRLLVRRYGLTHGPPPMQKVPKKIADHFWEWMLPISMLGSLPLVLLIFGFEAIATVITITALVIPTACMWYCIWNSIGSEKDGDDLPEMKMAGEPT